MTISLGFPESVACTTHIIA